MTDPHIHTLTGAYVLDAVDDVERRAFERHLAECPDCAREVDELRASAAVLGGSVGERPPDHLRDRVLREIAHTRQDPPRRSRSGVRPAARWRLRLTSAAAVLAVLAAVGLGVVAVRTNQQLGAVRDQLGQLQQHDAPVARILSAPDAHVITARSGGGTATVLVSHQLNQAVMLVAGMPTPPEHHVYQAWLLNSTTARSAGLIGRTPLLIDHLAGAAQIGITVEPAGGSAQPTMAPIVRVDLSA
jgi:anti-sigma-K factor RskA